MSQTKHTLQSLLALEWEVSPYRRPDMDDDPMGVYKVEPVSEKLTGQYDATDPLTDRYFYSVHNTNAAVARLLQAAPGLLRMLRKLLFDLKESHEDELLHNHYGDDLTACPCSYCEDIAAAEQLIKDIEKEHSDDQ